MIYSAELSSSRTRDQDVDLKRADSRDRRIEILPDRVDDLEEERERRSDGGEEKVKAEEKVGDVVYLYLWDLGSESTEI